MGPVSLTYKGTATFKDRDEADRSVLVEASGKEMRGSGTASATVRAALRPENGSEPTSATLVTLHTTLNVTGRPAQFGRGVITEVGSRLIDRFADNLAQQLASGGVAAAADGSTADGSTGAAPSAAAGEAAAASAAPPATAEVAGAGETAQAGEMGGTEGSLAAPRTAQAHVPVQSAPEPVQPVPVQHQDESLELLSLAGPVILKRLAPVVGAAVAVGLVTWGVRRLRQRAAAA